MTTFFLDSFKTICNTFSDFHFIFTRDINTIFGVTYFDPGFTLGHVMFGAGVFVFITAVVVKWVLSN